MMLQSPHENSVYNGESPDRDERPVLSSQAGLIAFTLLKPSVKTLSYFHPALRPKASL